MRVTIRYSLDGDKKGYLRKYVEGRLWDIAWIGGAPKKIGTTTLEGEVDLADFPKFGEEIGKLFGHLKTKASPHSDGMLDHFWMHCDVLDKPPSSSAPPASPACP